MGIRNLAFCLLRHSEETWEILAWDNVDLLLGGESAQTARRCCACPSPATWCKGEELWCKACATGVRRKKTATRIPTKPVLPCEIALKSLRAFATTQGWDSKAKKETLLQKAADHFLLPWKAPKATQPSLLTLLRAMDTWLNRMLPTFSQATLIRLENQPVMKGPTMKSVQMMLFTLLDHRLRNEHSWTGTIEFVHAGTKTRGAEVPTETETEAQAYRNRKKTAEEETLNALEKKGTETWITFFKDRRKKSDLADAFLMALRE